MKTIFNKTLLFTTLALGLLAPWSSSAQVFFSVRALLGEQFRASQRVDFVRVKPEKRDRARVEMAVGHTLPKAEYIFYVARSGETIDGYAIFDEEIGQHEYIDFATFFDAQGKVTRVEVVAYREPYGDAIRSRRFRKQFVGRSATSGFRPNKDIDVVAGATLSVRAMSKAVHRASTLLHELVLNQE